MADAPTPDADELKAYLAERDAPCPSCRYNLRGVAEPACPECNAHIELGLLDPRGPRLLWWFAIVCAVTIAIGEGLNGFSTLSVAQDYYGNPFAGGEWIPWVIAAGQASIGCVAAVCTVRLLLPPRRVGRRGLRIMLILATLYSTGWIINAVYWTGFARGWW